METKKARIKETIKNLEHTIKTMGDSVYVESISTAFIPTRAKKSDLKAKLKELKRKLNG
tara:strand:+ start:358 stop:534 length:177 start_codon:yes stop_codon:yes gene_type:complete